MLVGTKIGPFEILSELGSGAMGSVYKAKMEHDGRTGLVAIKMIAIGLTADDKARARFEREANILKQLKHPHIVRLIATGTHRKTPFIAMEFVDGKALDTKLAQRGRFGWEEVAVWGQQLCEALQHAHEKGIIHRDLKPSNLMLTSNGVLKLTDFGIAKDTDATAMTAANSTLGTASYMSPEQCRGERNLTAKSDLYALGIVLYELVTGRKPFTADNSMDMFLKHVQDVPVRPSRLAPDLPVWFDNLIMFLLEKKPDNRPLDATTVAKMLADIQEKVAAGGTVAQDVVEAKKKDRPVVSAPLEATDKATLTAIKTGAKSRKTRKPVPWHKKPWLPYVGLLLLVVGMAGMLYLVTRSPRLETLVAAVEAAPEADKAAPSKALLQHYATSTDPRVEKVRQGYVGAFAAKLDGQLGKLYRSKMKPDEGFDAGAFAAAVEAQDAEKNGDLAAAAEAWGRSADKAPEGDPAKLTDDSEARKLAWQTLATQRAALATKAVPEKLAQLQQRLDGERLNEAIPDAAGDDHESQALFALRADQFGDRAKAATVWGRLASATEKDAAARVWYLLATSQGAKASAERGSEPVAVMREKLLAERLKKLDADAAAAPTADVPLVAWRKLRVGCRELALLYEGDPSPGAKDAVKRAKDLLAQAPKPAKG